MTQFLSETTEKKLFEYRAPSAMRVLRFIKECVERGDGFPGQHDIANAMGWLNDSSVSYVLSRLVMNGYLKREFAQPGGRKRWNYSLVDNAEVREQARARSEASGRSRSQMRCDACKYWSAGHRCNRATSIAYSRKTSGEAHCQKWEPKK